MKKGFTLVELLAVIVLLGVLITLASFSIIKLKEDSENKLREEKCKYIETGAIKWGEEHLNELKENCGENETVKVTTLISSGYITSDATGGINIPGTNRTYSGFVCVKYSRIPKEMNGLSHTIYEVTADYVSKGGRGVCGK